MAEIHFGSYSRAFHRFYVIFHIVACTLCILLAVLSVLLYQTMPLKLVPVIFGVSGISFGVETVSTFRVSYRGQKRHILLGMFRMLIMAVLFGLAYVSARCLWY